MKKKKIFFKMFDVDVKVPAVELRQLIPGELVTVWPYDREQPVLATVIGATKDSYSGCIDVLLEGRIENFDRDEIFAEGMLPVRSEPFVFLTKSFAKSLQNEIVREIITEINSLTRR